jgi:hypothetical protein
MLEMKKIVGEWKKCVDELFFGFYFLQQVGKNNFHINEQNKSNFSCFLN